MRLLERSSGLQSERRTSVQDLCKSIDHLTTNLTGLGYSEARFAHLHQVVESAAGLSVELAKQRALFLIEKATGTFDAAKMEDVLQINKGEVLQGRQVESTVFPLVTRYGDDSGTGYEHGITIFKAQVVA